MMLLYQMSQWVDERQRLQQELVRGESGEDGEARRQIQELEERLYGHARQWMSSCQTPSAAAVPVSAYEPPQLMDPEPGLF